MSDARDDTAAPPAIAIRALCHTYPKAERPALDDVALQVAPGEVFAILGPNGGGKTTLFRILATMLRPTAGSAEVFGHDAVRQQREVRRRLGVVFQAPSLDVKLTARENLHHHGRLYGLGGGDLRNRIDEGLSHLDLADRADEAVERFSGGMRRRVELAKAMLHDPALLLLDEPSTGLDPGARRDLWDRLSDLRDRRGTTVALTTHLMDEADRCDRLAILDHGRVLAVDRPASLKARLGGDVVSVEANGEAEALAQQIAQRFAVRPSVSRGTIRWEQPDGPEVVAALGGAYGEQIRSITVGRPTLEDVFLSLTGESLEAPPPTPEALATQAGAS